MLPCTLRRPEIYFFSQKNSLSLRQIQGVFRCLVLGWAQGPGSPRTWSSGLWASSSVLKWTGWPRWAGSCSRGDGGQRQRERKCLGSVPPTHTSLNMMPSVASFLMLGRIGEWCKRHCITIAAVSSPQCGPTSDLLSLLSSFTAAGFDFRSEGVHGIKRIRLLPECSWDAATSFLFYCTADTYSNETNN